MYATPPLGRAGQCGFRGRGVTPVTFDVGLCGHILEFNIFVWQKKCFGIRWDVGGGGKEALHEARGHKFESCWVQNNFFALHMLFSPGCGNRD